MSQKHYNQTETARTLLSDQCETKAGIARGRLEKDINMPPGHQNIANEICSMRATIISLESLIDKIQGSESSVCGTETCDPRPDYSLATLLTEAPSEMANITSIVHDKINHINDLLF